MSKSPYRLAAIAFGLMVAVPAAQAGYSVDVYVDNVFSYTVNDNGLGDDNPLVGDIEHHFSLNDLANRWEANGVIFAEGGLDGALPVSTIVTATTIEKVANVPINYGEIDFHHHYAASGLQMHSASIDGEFDNLLTGHNVGGASIAYMAEVTGFNLGTFATGIYSGPGPHPFMGFLGPIVTPTTIEHHIQLGYYLDTLGDKIEMFDSAELHTVPDPATLALLAAGGALISRRRATS